MTRNRGYNSTNKNKNEETTKPKKNVLYKNLKEEWDIIKHIEESKGENYLSSSLKYSIEKTEKDEKYEEIDEKYKRMVTYILSGKWKTQSDKNNKIKYSDVYKKITESEMKKGRIYGRYVDWNTRLYLLEKYIEKLEKKDKKVTQKLKDYAAGILLYYAKSNKRKIKEESIKNILNEVINLSDKYKNEAKSLLDNLNDNRKNKNTSVNQKRNYLQQTKPTQNINSSVVINPEINIKNNDYHQNPEANGIDEERLREIIEDVIENYYNHPKKSEANGIDEERLREIIEDVIENYSQQKPTQNNPSMVMNPKINIDNHPKKSEANGIDEERLRKIIQDEIKKYYDYHKNLKAYNGIDEERLRKIIEDVIEKYFPPKNPNKEERKIEENLVQGSSEEQLSGESSGGKYGRKWLSTLWQNIKERGKKIITGTLIASILLGGVTYYYKHYYTPHQTTPYIYQHKDINKGDIKEVLKYIEKVIEKQHPGVNIIVKYSNDGSIIVWVDTPYSHSWRSGNEDEKKLNKMAKEIVMEILKELGKKGYKVDYLEVIDQNPVPNKPYGGLGTKMHLKNGGETITLWVAGVRHYK